MLHTSLFQWVITKIIEDMPITYDMEKDAFFLKGEKRGESGGEEKTIRAFVLNNKQKGRTM